MTDATTRINGCVKWFNNKAGYGFISADVNTKVQDIFVHHTAVKTADNQFRYLVEGEYVEFTINKCDLGRMTAVDVSGANGKKLMCESRYSERDMNHSRRGEMIREEPSTKRGNNAPSHFDGRNKLHVAGDGSVWELVSKGKGKGKGKGASSHDSPPRGVVKIEVDV